MNKLRNITVWLFAFVLIFQIVPGVSAQGTALNDEMIAKIKKEAMENSKIMETLHYLTDVYGPRLTGSPNLVNAGKWSMKRMTEFGFDRTDMEPWDFGSPGWSNERATGAIISPVRDNLVFEVLAWTPSTNGVVAGSVLTIEPPVFKNGDDPKCLRQPSAEELDNFLNSIRDKVPGKIVMIREPADLGVDFNPPPLRIPDSAFVSNNNQPRNAPAPAAACPKPEMAVLSLRDTMTKINTFLESEKAALIAADGRMRLGTIRAFGNRDADPLKTIPQVILRNEDYGRIWRLAKDGKDVRLEFYIKNRYYPEGKTAYNTIGEISGTSKKDEVVMMGGHLDSWHSATGATDNAIGCAIMMEAGRILKALGVKPKRTIRVALWGGEEQGLLGSQAYVEKHFGSAEAPKPEYAKFAGYFNVDSGTGRVRQWSVFGPDEASKALGNALNNKFPEMEFMGVTPTTSRRLGGSDHTSFNRAGLPGIGARQDPIEYFTFTWHTNLDTYERIVQDDVKQTAALVAAGVYELAMREELLPRFSAETMPKLNQ